MKGDPGDVCLFLLSAGNWHESRQHLPILIPVPLCHSCTQPLSRLTEHGRPSASLAMFYYWPLVPVVREWSCWLRLEDYIRKNVIWKSLSISYRFPKNRKFGEIVEIAGKFQVTTANFLEGFKLFNFFLNFPIWNLYLRDYIVLPTSAYAHLECHAISERTVTSEWTSSSCETQFI